jgi:tetratricopeptide (TPR) repeat protein
VAYQCYGLYLIARKRFDEALAQMKQALEIDPISPFIKTIAAFPYYYSGQFKQAADLFLDTLEEDPQFGLAHAALGDVYVQTGRYDDAIAHYEQARSKWGEKLVLPYIGYTYALSNRKEEAIGILETLEQMAAHEYISPFFQAVVHAGLGAEDELFALLEKAYSERSMRLAFLGVLPIFNKFHGDDRFLGLLKRIGLEY